MPMTLINSIMPYFDEFIHVYGWDMSILWYPLKIWTPKNFTTAKFRHPVSKSWLRHWPRVPLLRHTLTAGRTRKAQQRRQREPTQSLALKRMRERKVVGITLVRYQVLYKPWGPLPSHNLTVARRHSLAEPGERSNWGWVKSGTEENERERGGECTLFAGVVENLEGLSQATPQLWRDAIHWQQDQESAAT